MSYAIAQGIQVSINGTDWYQLSDHNRQPIDITYTLIESTDRMANGTLRKYIVARKFIISADWTDFPSLDSNVVDAGNNVHAAAWIKAFYEGNYANPVYVKLIFAQEKAVQNSVPQANSYTDSKTTPVEPTQAIYTAYMTTFTYNIKKRRQGYDYVDLKIEFTEV